jgi:hypothetical protein
VRSFELLDQLLILRRPRSGHPSTPAVISRRTHFKCAAQCREAKLYLMLADEGVLYRMALAK